MFQGEKHMLKHRQLFRISKKIILKNTQGRHKKQCIKENEDKNIADPGRCSTR